MPTLYIPLNFQDSHGCLDGNLIINEFGSFDFVVSDFPSNCFCYVFHVTFFSFKDSIDSMTHLTFSPVSFLNRALLFGTFIINIPQKKVNPKHFFLFYDRSKWHDSCHMKEPSLINLLKSLLYFYRCLVWVPFSVAIWQTLN